MSIFSDTNKLFLGGTSERFHTNTCFNFTRDQWDVYAEGYKRAGEIIFEHIISIQREQDYLAFPMLFNYRQYIELRLKQIIVNCGGEFTARHNLSPLWAEAKGLVCDRLSSQIDEDTERDIAIFGGLLDEFDDMDHKSMAFRYPVDLKGSPHIAELRSLDLMNIYTVMCKISRFLDSIIGMIDAHTSFFHPY